MNAITIFILHFLVFSIIHSILATDYFKNKIKQIFGNGFRFYRLIYTIISFILFAPLLIIWAKYTNITPLIYSAPLWLHPVLFLIRLLAAILFVYALFQTDILEFIGIKQIKGQTNSMLITSGSYGITRHPLYTGVMGMLFTKTTMSQLDLILVIFVSIYFVIGAYIEERRLHSIFGEEYEKYKQNVSMFLPLKKFTKDIF